MALQKTYLIIEGKKVPTKVYRENRRSVRASVGKNAVILRMPAFLNRDQESQQLDWFENWVKEQISKNDSLKNRFFGKNYQDGDLLRVGARQYLLSIQLTDRKTHSGRLNNGVITLKLAESDQGAHLAKNMRHLLSRIIAQDFLPHISRKVNELNNLYFRKPIKSVNLKYNQSNWGSCSTRGNINLSTRLLFAPEEVIDYVIIHELAHLEEMNHSSRFWKLVANAMPDYKGKEKWLKENGHLCSF